MRTEVWLRAEVLRYPFPYRLYLARGLAYGLKLGDSPALPGRVAIDGSFGQGDRRA